MLNTIYQTLRTLINLCLFRASPAELPFSTLWLALVVALEFGLNIATLHDLKGAQTTEIILATFLSIVVSIGLIYFLLAQRKIQSRLHKVLIAWFGTELILTLVLKLMLFIIPSSLQVLKVVQAVLEIGFLTWNIAIKTYIVKRACDIKVASAILITFGILVVSSVPIQFILGAYLAQAIGQP